VDIEPWLSGHRALAQWTLHPESPTTLLFVVVKAELVQRLHVPLESLTLILDLRHLLRAR